MKKTLLLGLITFLYFNVNAQTITKKSAIGISIGPSFPLGDFGDKDISNENSGLAKIGGFLGIDYSYTFSKYFGGIVSLQGRLHSVDENALSAYAVPDGTGASLSMKTTAWKTGSIMAGIFHTVPLTKNEKLNFEVRALAGLQSTSSPKIDVNVFIPGMGSFNSSQESTSVNSFTYSLGMAFKYSLDNRMALKLGGDYNGAQPKFSTYSYPADAPVEQEVKQSTGAFNLAIGLSIGF
ncbi:outer membrane beta-barrel protein [Pedobacter sp. LMG 31464]|uniref:Outer membrane beta-barrel protein n=1 Tax=Pedobacter planticolens TaxID=2679964 RepID=A0A923E003_9SPHI|nr:outer membrane beta-barrel protein [Pedobacter planticolens]MBB2144997.1 outer membrane beta-barrel protein [Pedobacter planticolens]